MQHVSFYRVDRKKPEFWPNSNFLYTLYLFKPHISGELIDFFRFNSYFALGLEKYEPISTESSKNSLVYRGLEGFVAAIAPFNFTAIGGNLSGAPAIIVRYF
jgi:hypothetical protein